MPQRKGFTLIELLIVTAVFSLIALVATTVITRIQSTQRQILGRQRVVADGRYVLEAMGRTIRQNLINYKYYCKPDPNTGYCTSSPSGAQTILALKDTTNVETCYLFDNVNKKIRIISGTSVTNCAGPSPVDITPADLAVDDFHIYITPKSDPFKTVPRQNTDCKVAPVGNPVTSGYDPDRSVCACVVQPISTIDCYPDQVCGSTANVGQVCDPFANGGTGEKNCICQNANQQPQVTLFISTRSVNQASGEKSHSTLQTTVTSHLYRR